MIEPNSFGQYPIVQIGWTVFEDVEVAARRWTELTGAGPFFVLRNVPMLNVVHRGVPRGFDHSCAIGQWGDVQIELMHQHCDSPSHLRDLSPDDQPRMSSVSWVVDDIDEEIARLARLHCPIVMQGNILDGSFSTTWFDTSAVLGSYAEVFVEHPTLRMSLARCREAAAGWDGSRPIRDQSELFDQPSRDEIRP